MGEDKRARAALRNCEPTLDLEANRGIAASLRKSEAVWASRTNRVPCSETIMLLLDTKTEPNEAGVERQASDMQGTNGSGNSAALVRLRRYGRLKEVWVSRQTTLGELAKVYGGESGWEVRENPNSPALFAGLKVSDLSPTNELGGSEEALNLELFQDALWHQGPRVQNKEDLVPQPQQPHPRRAGRMGKAGRRAAPNGETSETSQSNGCPVGGVPQPNVNLSNGNVNVSTTNGNNVGGFANGEGPVNGNGNGGSNGNGHNGGYNVHGHNGSGPHGNRNRGQRRGNRNGNVNVGSDGAASHVMGGPCVGSVLPS